MDHGQRASDQTGWDSVGAALRAASACRKSTPAAAFSDRCLRNVCVQGRNLPARPASEVRASPVGCCHRRWQRDPKVGGETVSAMVMEARMMEQPELSCQRPMMPQA